VNELTRQVNKIAGAMNKIMELDMKISNLAASVNMSPEITQALSERIDEIYYYLESMQPEEKDAGIQELYECSQCHARRLVALHVKCTNCGNENWMGWWPKYPRR
jgi:hypothetical protein